MPEPEARILPLDQLHEFPLQPLLAGIANEQDDADLASSIESHGQEKPIEILPAYNNAGLPANTILDGHRRRVALLLNGEIEGEVVVRHDLRDASREEVDAFFFRANLDRRQLDALGKATLARRLIETERAESFDTMSEHARGDLRDRIGELLGISGRHLSRILKVSTTSPLIQAATRLTSRQDKLTIVQAEKVADLSSEQQAEIDERIRNGETARKVVAEFVGEPGQRAASSETTFNRYVRALGVALEAMEDSLEKICFSPRKNDLDLLGRASELNEALINRLAGNRIRDERERAEADREMDQLLAEL